MFDHLQKLTSRSPKETSAGDTGFSSALVGAAQRRRGGSRPSAIYFSSLLKHLLKTIA